MAIRFSGITLTNIKNVKNGHIEFPHASDKDFNHSDILALYGQNGSGKTAVVESFGLLSDLYQKGEHYIDENLIHMGENEAEISYFFVMEKDSSIYEILYKVGLHKKLFEYDSANETAMDESTLKKKVSLCYEKILFRDISQNRRPKYKLLLGWEDIGKDMVSFKPDKIAHAIFQRDFSSGQIHQEKITEADYFRLIMNLLTAKEKNYSFFFSKENRVEFEKELDVTSRILYKALYEYSANLRVVKNIEAWMSCSTFFLVLSEFQEKKTKYLNLLESTKVSMEELDSLEKSFERISLILTTIVPGLIVVTESVPVTLDSGEKGAAVSILSVREGRRLPLRCESAGVIKLISLLSHFLFFYSDPSALVVVDELDSGIFEFLLGQIIGILQKHGKGQMLFTSHNLRALEVLDKNSLVFTTANPENRFIRLKGIRETNNIRSIYIRSLQVGGQDEDLAFETNDAMIRNAFGLAEVQ